MLLYKFQGELFLIIDNTYEIIMKKLIYQMNGDSWSVGCSSGNF
jgi:hypothetical protein